MQNKAEANKEIPFKVNNGMLEGPDGAWEIAKISAIYKREAGRIGIKKWLITLAGLTAVGAVASGPIIPSLALAGGTFGYMTHRTMRVFAMIEGTETEIHSEVYFDLFIGADKAISKCEALISLVKGSM
jgi:hypothetical protein